MDTWNREELYRDIWNEPMLTLSKKYGVSAVMLGKVCRKLSIPVPGRGYWARKAFGHSVKVKPLPRIGNVPVVQRFKLPGTSPSEPKSPEAEPSDAEYLRILEVESLQISVDPSAPLHRLVATTAKAFRSAHTDSQGYRNTKGRIGVLDLNLTDRTIDRAILILNSVLSTLEKEGYPVKFKQDTSHAFAAIFGQEIGFEIVEKYNQTRIPENQRKTDYFAPKVKSEANGNLEFRVLHSRYGHSAVRDSKRNSLEQKIPNILGAFLREARSAKLGKERERQQEIERREREIERFKLSEQIREEEKKLENFDAWVANWSRARLYREFISALEEYWRARGEDLSDGGERANRLIWMRQQADRLDPLVKSPASILDRKSELSRY
jgi:hypothetical protein